RDAAVHVSLSSHLQLSKNRRHQSRHKLSKPNPKARQSISISANFKRFCLNQSAARLVGAALSFGEAAYTATPICRQQPIVKKLSFLISQGKS
ncbi:MAG: hypothetical protein KUL88_09635, partial [Rhizobium sp.]|nr:hypothetical protein [Rhizobium sp.]